MIGYRTTLAALALLSSSITALAAPAAKLSVLVGPPTQKVTVTGTGFAATQLFDIYFDTADLCVTASSAAGAISCAITVPKDAQPQQLWFTLAQRSGIIGYIYF